MNRLILVGNGFDLAHGLKTSYKDFIIWYLANCFYRTDPWLGTYGDNLIGVKIYNINHFKDYVRQRIKPPPGFLLQEEEIRQLFNSVYESGDLCNFLGIYEKEVSDLIVESNRQDSSSHSKSYPIFELIIESAFLRSLIVTCQDCNWVDIENEYFDHLKACKTKDGSFDRERVMQLNKEFAYLKQKLEQYLKLHQEQANTKVIPDLLNAIKSEFEISDFEATLNRKDLINVNGDNYEKGSISQYKLYFLNFNYTNTLSIYFKAIANSDNNFSEIPLERLNDTNANKFHSFEINHIHGVLGNGANPIIFGFGDEHDKVYKEFEEHRNKELFDHIKSYQYLRTPHYRNLLKFLNSDNYQVFVMGHSCGLSDRTMFKAIFEHENCKSIRLFHYNGDFHDKAINVSKHFSDKGHMRKLIVDYKVADAFPQSTGEA